MGKNKSTKKTICIQIPINTDEYLRKFVLDNAHMYNRIRNDFVEEANKFKGDHNMYDDFKPGEFKTQYYNSIEVPENRYDKYCVGLSEQIASNFIKSTKAIRTKNRKVFNHESNYNIGEYHFKKFDINRYTFRVKLKPGYINDKFYSRISIIDKNTIKFRVRSNKFNRTEEFVVLNLREPLFDNIILNNDGNHLFIRYYKSNDNINECTFTMNDIKDIAFKYELDNYYIQLFIDVTYDVNKKSLKYLKDRVCGIDTGIHHPITIYDGINTYYISMDEKTSRKIHYLERRIKRLDKVLQYKYTYNKEHGISTDSNNIKKLIKKMRKIYKNITNIKIHWIKNTCKTIATSYSAIVVDRFEQPDHTDEDSKNLPTKVLHDINYNNRFHNMYYFNEFLKHDCDKYGCKYIESPPDSTRTCSVCKHINPHLKLTDRYLVCEKCGSKIERDENAAKNCYDYFFETI